MKRPTISLACILKNEAHNIGPLLSSIKGCFDEIVFVDTGSTDNSLFFIEQVNKQIESGSLVWDGIPEIKVYHFDWVNDFSKARNFAFEKCTKDYIMWLDLDDQLSSAENFIIWRDNVLHAGHYWVALYNYAFNDKGEVECQFIRERVIKRNHGFKWVYPVHEGLMQVEGKKYWPQRANTWWVNHRRTKEDIKQDHMRNVKLMESLKLDEMHPRMKFYYGKELFENGMKKEAGKPLMEAAKSPELELHDRVLTIQFAAQSAIDSQAHEQALELLYNGLRLVPQRAEFWCLIGDVYLQRNQVSEASHAYKTAIQCQPNDFNGTVVIYRHAYSEYPYQKLAQIALVSGNAVQAEEWIDKLHEMGSASVTDLEKELQRVKDLSEVRSGLPKSEDVIITCPPQMPGDWDEITLEKNGHGGSETAAIEVARWIKQKTNRRVKIFQARKSRDVMPSGVEYLPIHELEGYLKNVEPYAHIAWRHPSKLTNAKTYVWCHDLMMPGADQSKNYDKIVALSGFHRHYLHETCNIPFEKIVLGFNGINPKDFEVEAERDSLKVVFSSSPDRGLVQSVDIVKKAREISGLDIKLHCFYGTHNMRKMGLTAWADAIEKKIEDNKDFVTYHGQVNKKTLMKHFKEAAVWLYPADFIETYCITAIEALCAGCYPLVRRMGALPYTLKDALQDGMCDMLDIEAIEGDETNTALWAHHLVEAILDKRWQNVKVDIESKSWERVADWFIEQMNLRGNDGSSHPG